ncbi:MAG: alpha/beta hydrolase [Micrococcales bacterium]|nr:alpha/beta hydrolase [Micrococcales bacterium]
MKSSAAGISDFSVALVDGPWEHRMVAASALRFHVALTGPSDGPMVLLLHGVPQFWWAMRHQLIALGQAGYRAVAMDMRGCGASDKPPEGYTLPVLARDVAGVARALGATKVAVVGHGVGGMVSWTMLSQDPKLLAGVAAISAIHPGSRLPARKLMVSPRALAETALLWLVPIPLQRARRRQMVKKVLGSWSQVPDWLTPEAWELYRAVMDIPNASEKSVKLLRWILRPSWSRARRRFAAGNRLPAQVPVLHIQGDKDRLVDASAVAEPILGGDRYQLVSLGGVGHFPPEEAPDQVNQILKDWLANLDFADSPAP